MDEIRQLIKIRAIAVTILFFCIPLFYSCVKDDDRVTFSTQEASIDKYIQSLVESQNFRYEVYDGVWRVVMEEGEGNIVVAQGSQIKIDYAIFKFESGQGEQYTNIESLGDGDDWLIVGNGNILKGLDIGLVGAKLNERCYIIFSARHGFGNTQVGIIPKMTPLLVEVWIKEIKDN